MHRVSERVLEKMDAKRLLEKMDVNASEWSSSHSAAWVKNSPFFDRATITKNCWRVLYVLLIVSVGVVVHSYFIHRGKKNWKRRWPTTRIFADLSACASFFGFFMCVIAYYHPSMTAAAVCYDLLWLALLNLIIQLCDNYAFLNRFLAVQTVSKWKRYSIQCYIWVIMVCPWIFPWTVIQFFMDTNTLAFWDVANNFRYINNYGSLLFNCYFTYEFSKVIYEVNTRVLATRVSNDRNVSIMKIISWKSLSHCLISSASQVYCLYFPGIGFTVYPLAVVLSLHLLFNYKIESITGCRILQKHKFQCYLKRASVLPTATLSKPSKSHK